MKREQCPNCKKLLIEPIGTPGILLAGTYPGYDEVIRGIPFCGPTGDILRAELARVGIPIQRVRLTNLWLHEKDEKGCDLKWHLNRLSKEISASRIALLMGSDLAKALFNCGIMDISGLEMKHQLFPKTRLFMSPNPADAMREPVGELRLALSRFKEALDG